MNAKKEENWYVSFAKGAITGSLYGATTIAVGQPLDTVKTQMQAQSYFSNSKSGFLTSLQKTVKQDGLIGLYKGSLSAFIGSVIYRSAQWAVYDGAYSYLNHERYAYKIPFTGDLQLRVILASVAAGTGRALVECPFEYAKVKRQVGEPWVMKEIYKGFAMLWAKDVPLFIVALSLIDSMKRHTNAMDSYFGIFVGTGTCTTIAWASVWPLETLKNQIQADNIHRPLAERLAILKKTYGVFGLYRGMLPGMLSIFFRNGASFVSMIWAKQQLESMSY